MADEEQFSLCWNNFNTNLSAGFHESLCRGDLVDVTLAAEGQLVKAHRLVLSVCSPYFRKMFTQMPGNQHAFVFLKDVSASALKDLIQFMYCGEVNVKQEALPAFISTAEQLQIKGLTESNDGTVTAAGSSPTKEVITSTPHPDPALSRPRAHARIIAQRPQAFKIESEGSSDEKQTVTLVQTNQAGKRPIARTSITQTAAPKRIKMTQQTQESADPLDEPEHEIVTPQLLKVSENTEFIDLPIESTHSHLNPKTEPEYVEDTQEIETEQDDDQYVEDVTYGEEKYDESYFTEGDDKAGVSGFSETYATEGDQSATEAQGCNENILSQIKMVTNGEVLYNGNRFVKFSTRGNFNFFCCIKYPFKCPAKLKIDNLKKTGFEIDKHNHKHDKQQTMINDKAVKTEDGKDDLLFNKDVTSEVELITNDKNTTVLFLHGFKFTKYFEGKSDTSYRCVKHQRSTGNCLCRIKYSSETGEFLMRSEHNHAVDETLYQNFFESAVRVRKFTRKFKPKTEPMNESNGSDFDMGNFALEMMQKKLDEKPEENEDDLLVEVFEKSKEE